MQKTILHIITPQKFISQFIDVINENFNPDIHTYISFHKGTQELGLRDRKEIVWVDNKLQKILFLLVSMYKSDKIILHGLFSRGITLMLFLNPWLLKKCYWVMWGGDFYFPKKQNWFKKRVIKRIRNFVTYIKGDFELVKKWYGAEGEYHECFMYPSNLYKEYNITSKEDNTLNIQVGNSAILSNNHIEVLENLRKYKDENIKIYVPLSYGPQGHVESVISKGKEIFGDKFIALTDFMSFEKYLDFLGTIDVAIFAHKRQQAMGNIITLLGLGKKVYMRNDITTWQLFKDIDVRLFDYNNIELNSIDNTIKQANIEKVRSYFSEEKYLKQLENIFD